MLAIASNALQTRAKRRKTRPQKCKNACNREVFTLAQGDETPAEVNPDPSN
jgi:hypothetical protein